MKIPRSIPEYRRFLERELAEVNEVVGQRDVPLDVCEGFATTIRNIGRLATSLGLWQTAARCNKCRTSHLGIRTARQAILDALAELNESPPAEFLTVKEAASRLSVSERTVYDLVRAGRLNAQRIGNGRGAIRITPADLGNISQPSRRLRHL